MSPGTPIAGLLQDLLVFSLDGALYALDAALVRTTVWLPELSPAPEAPAGIVGCFNLRGQIVPVADLAFRLGHGVHRRRAGDRVVVLELDGGALGILASSVEDLVQPGPGQRQPRRPYDTEPADGLAAGTLQLDEGLATLLDLRQFAHPAGFPNPASEEAFYQEATPEENALFQARAEALRQAEAGEEPGGTVLAVVELGGQYLGIDLAEVWEFCRVPQLFPLPCCPPHVAGVFNLRGHFVTLLEISSAFALPLPASPRTQAVIGRLEGKAVAVAVDEVIDTFTPRAEELRPAPALSQAGAAIRAVASFAGRRVWVVDLVALLGLEQWVVDEAVA